MGSLKNTKSDVVRDWQRSASFYLGPQFAEMLAVTEAQDMNFKVNRIILGLLFFFVLTFGVMFLIILQNKNKEIELISKNILHAIASANRLDNTLAEVELANLATK